MWLWFGLWTAPSSSSRLAANGAFRIWRETSKMAGAFRALVLTTGGGFGFGGKARPDPSSRDLILVSSKAFSQVFKIEFKISAIYVTSESVG